MYLECLLYYWIDPMIFPWNLHGTTAILGATGHTIHFNENGDARGRYTIYQFQRQPHNQHSYVRIGTWTDRWAYRSAIISAALLYKSPPPRWGRQVNNGRWQAIILEGVEEPFVSNDLFRMILFYC